MDNEKIKAMLLEIQNTNLDFTVIMTGKESTRVNGLYKPDTREILLHNRNFKTDNQLVYTAIHEYTHHLINEEKIAQAEELGLKPSYNGKSHTTYFWAKFGELLDIAEQKGMYKLDLSETPELEELTKEIREKYIMPNGHLMQELGKALIKAHALCDEANIRYEDYVDRILQLPRPVSQKITKISMLPESDADLGFENMKIIASCKNNTDKQKAIDAIKTGKSPDSVIQMMKKKAKEQDPKSRLEKEKARLENTINQLKTRLEYVEESLANME